MKKTLYLLFITAFLAQIAFTTLPQQAFAAGSYRNDFNKMPVTEKAQVWVLARAVSKCIPATGALGYFGNGFETNNKNVGDINKGEWLTDAGAEIGEWSADLAEGQSDDAKADCRKVAQKTLGLMGISGVDAICKMNDLASKSVWKRTESGDCKNGTGDLDFDESNNNKNDTEIWNRLARDFMGSSLENALTNPMRYVIYSKNFYQECSKDHGGGWGTPRLWKDGDKEGKKVYKINIGPWGNSTYDPTKEWYVASGGNDREHKVNIDGYGLLFKDDNATCAQLADRINTHAAAFATKIKEDADTGIIDPNSAQAQNDKATCESSGGAGGLSFLICPVLEALDWSISFFDDQISALLYIDTTTYSNDNVSTGWGVMRNLALLILVPMMALMVIGTAMSFGPFDPYTVKKALPRMFVAVLFIVLSLPLAEFAVRISNAVGQGLGNALISLAPTGAESISTIISQRFPEAVGTGGAAALGGIVAVSTGAVTVGIILSLAVTVFIALLIGFIILVMRQVFVVILIIVAPLAILAWIFPGNDKLWGIWKSTFIAMLMLYPIISLLIASGKFVAAIFGNQ